MVNGSGSMVSGTSPSAGANAAAGPTESVTITTPRTYGYVGVGGGGGGSGFTSSGSGGGDGSLTLVGTTLTVDNSMLIGGGGGGGGDLAGGNGGSGDVVVQGGATLAVAGTLQIGGSGGGGGVDGNGGDGGSGILTVDSTSNLVIGGATGSLILGGADGGDSAFGGRGGSHGTGTLNVSGTLTLTGASATIRTGSALNLGSPLVGFTTSGGITGGSIANSGTLNFNQTNSATISSVISGSGAVNQNGGGITILSGANTYTGATTIVAGTVAGGAADAFSAASAAMVNGSGTLDLGGYDQAIGSLAGNGRVTNNGNSGIATLTVGGDGSSTTFSGSLEDGAQAQLALTKTGIGTLVLDGAESYSGGTTVNGGTLQLGAGGSLSPSGGLTVQSFGIFDLNGHSQTVASLSGSMGIVALGSGALTVDQSSDTTYAGSISGGGSLIKTGTGSLVLNGVNTYTGLTTISGGIIEVGDAANPGASLAGAVTVDAGGTLAGHGTIAGDVGNTLGGTVRPGGSIGTLSVGGNYTQGSAGTLAIEVSPGAASKLVVGGTASLGGALVLTYDPGFYTARSYTIVEAGSVAGRFDTVTDAPAAGLGQTVDYSTTAVTLVLSPLTVAPTATGIIPASEIAILSDGQTANRELFSYLGSSGDPGLDGDRAVPAELQADQPKTTPARRGWVRAIGGLQSIDGNAGAAGFNSSAGGFLTGLDGQVNDRLTAGIAAGYSRGQLSSSDDGDAIVESPRLMVYGSYALDPLWTADASLGYAFDGISTRRSTATGTATGSYYAHEGIAEAELRGDFSAPGGFRLTPAAGMRYVVLAEQGYTESGAAGNDLTVAARTGQSAQPFIGIAAERDFTGDDGTVWTLRASLEYAHELMPAQSAVLDVGGGTFTADPPAASRDRVTVGADFKVRLTNALAFSVNYQALLPTGNAASHTASATLHYAF